ncbi:hypothetical protein GGR26_001580 [Lewinella marina]|uniref:Plasmid pRiA4b Orf3-like domain-containing protein n=1 Tax=Neolewinella marina TaxID=438751 RepID=A0A2G0CEU5_9BACT|nr:plasmid pRiA4b ORF-3 family protein [Neolewinella marina]NJB85835.1 hypothetical protein [Neolewinella marina]PHK98496.1 hypothetical protein CGL56_08440 [Neolewinella marina]
MSTDNLQQAIATAVADVRSQFPALSDHDVTEAYRSYLQHFSEREDEPPVSYQPEVDELLLAIWDVIVDRETEGLDHPEGDLEDFYAAAFTGLLSLDPAPALANEPVAVPETVEENPSDPAPVADAEGEDDLGGDMAAQETSPLEPVFLLRITLDGSQPTIWREVLVPADVRQTQLHHIIQAAMGWRGTEDFQFFPSQHREQTGPGEPQLGDLLGKVGEQCGYEFDNWYHDLELRDIRTPHGSNHYPVCTAGERACPPQDIGGVAAYNEKIKILNDPSHYEYEELASWLTQDFNPGAFNIQQANLRLGQYGDHSFQAVV